MVSHHSGSSLRIRNLEQQQQLYYQEDLYTMLRIKTVYN